MNMDFHKLVDSHAGGVFRIHRALPDAALHIADSHDMRTVAVRLSATRDKNAFLAGVAAALHFPPISDTTGMRSTIACSISIPEKAGC